MPDDGKLVERLVQMPQQRRLAPVQSIKADTRTVQVMWSAGARVRRYDWWDDEVFFEELDMSPDAVDMSRLNGGAPVLDTHNRYSLDGVLGVVENAWLNEGRGFADLRFSERDDVTPIWQDVQGGIIRNVSVAYEILEMREVGRDPATGYRIMRAVRWQPYEISLVPIGADQEAGTRDHKPPASSECLMKFSQPAAPAATKGVRQMPDDVKPAAGASAEQEAAAGAEQNMSAIERDKLRIKAIEIYGKTNNIDERTVDKWIRGGVQLDKIAEEILAVHEERGKARPTAASDLGLSRSEQQRYSLFRVMRLLSALPGDVAKRQQEAAYEIECSKGVAQKLGREPDGFFIPGDILRRPVDPEAAQIALNQQRTMTAQPGSAGGYLIQTDNLGFIEILRNVQVLSSMGARSLTGLQGNVAIPRQTGATSVTWQAGETTTVTSTDQTLGQLSMTPKTAIIVTDVGRTLMMQSSPSAESMVMADLARGTALGIDLAGLVGTGGAQPIGIINTAGITTGQDASTATYAKVLAFQSVAAASNALLGRPGYVARPVGAAALMSRSRFSNTDTPLWDGNIMRGMMAGFAAMSSMQMPADGSLLFGSFDSVVIGEWGVLELTLNPYQNFNAGVVGIRAIYTVDVLVRYPQAFVYSTNLS